MGADVVRPLLAIAFVFALLAAAAWRFGRRGATPKWFPRPNTQLKSREHVRLTPQHSVHLIALEGRSWLVGCHPQGLTLLSDLSGAAEVEHRTGVSA